jgi:hypothetical protein
LFCQHVTGTIIRVRAKEAVAAAVPGTYDESTNIGAAMRIPNRDLLVLLKNEYASQKAIEQEVESINDMLVQAESPEQFCRAHELVVRNRITSRCKKILQAIRFTELKPFRFLINKN